MRRSRELHESADVDTHVIGHHLGALVDDAHGDALCHELNTGKSMRAHRPLPLGGADDLPDPVHDGLHEVLPAHHRLDLVSEIAVVDYVTTHVVSPC